MHYCKLTSKMCLLACAFVNAVEILLYPFYVTSIVFMLSTSTKLFASILGPSKSPDFIPGSIPRISALQQCNFLKNVEMSCQYIVAYRLAYSLERLHFRYCTPRAQRSKVAGTTLAEGE